MANIDDLRNAGKNATQKTNAALQSKIERLTSDKLSQIISELKKTTIQSSEIEPLIQQISTATNKNKIILDVVNKGGNLANAIIAIVTKFI
ncbi:MAG: hypothetical protein ACYCZ2_07585 [Lutibacter sp.]